MNKKRLIVLSSPSGGGKSTLARHILNNYKDVSFSVSCTTRKMRDGEINGVHYHFVEKEKFVNMIEESALIEYEQIFENFYGTRKQDVQNALDDDKFLLFDIDVKGASNIKKTFPNDSLLIFIDPPNLETLETRLRSRSTESEEQIQIRLSRAKMELENSKDFDVRVINDILENTINKLDEILLSAGMIKK